MPPEIGQLLLASVKSAIAKCEKIIKTFSFFERAIDAFHLRIPFLNPFVFLSLKLCYEKFIFGSVNGLVRDIVQ